MSNPYPFDIFVFLRLEHCLVSSTAPGKRPAWTPWQFRGGVFIVCKGDAQHRRRLPAAEKYLQIFLRQLV